MILENIRPDSYFNTGEKYTDIFKETFVSVEVL